MAILCHIRSEFSHQKMVMVHSYVKVYQRASPHVITSTLLVRRPLGTSFSSHPQDSVADPAIEVGGSTGLQETNFMGKWWLDHGKTEV